MAQRSGLPLPVDALHSYCEFFSLLPCDRHITTTNGQAYEYDPVMQRTNALGSMLDYFKPPTGGGINYDDGYVFTNWSASTMWFFDSPYWFIGANYWRWHPAGTGPSGEGVISSGWIGSPDAIDGMVTDSLQWAHIFKGSTVYRYDNLADTMDVGNGFSKSIFDYLGPTAPPWVDEAELQVATGHLMIFTGNQVDLYNPRTYQQQRGYPLPIHEDAADGGQFGVGRTACSGNQHLTMPLGFVEDKSPDPKLRTLPYANYTHCKWTLHVPQNALKTLANGVPSPAFELLFTRFDLGPGAVLRIYANRDAPTADVLAAHKSGQLRDGTVVAGVWGAA